MTIDEWFDLLDRIEIEMCEEELMLTQKYGQKAMIDSPESVNEERF